MSNILNMRKCLPTAAEWRSGNYNVFRNHALAMAGEFCGTFLFLFFAFTGTQIAVIAGKGLSSNESVSGTLNVINLLYISFAFGSSVAINVWAFYRISGAHFNPAITLGLMLIGAVPFNRGILLFPAQLIGAIAAAGIVSNLFPDPLAAGVSLGAGISVTQGLFIEMFLTIELVFVVFMLAVEKHRATFVAPLGIGLALFVTQIAGVYYTGAGVNPVRAFAPDVINGFTNYQWIYWVGPFMGSFVATGFYLGFKRLGYETVNPGQDAGPESVLLIYKDEEAALAGKSVVQELQVVERSIASVSPGYASAPPPVTVVPDTPAIHPREGILAL